MASVAHRGQASGAAPRNNSYSTLYASPTNSDFSEADADAIKNWGEARVADWLRSINASQYVELFKANNITGENLMDIDQEILKEIGVNKVGDRVRINQQAKMFRKNAYFRKRQNERSSALNAEARTGNSSAGSAAAPAPSPKAPRPARSQPQLRADKVVSSRVALPTDSVLGAKAKVMSPEALSRPTSPYLETESRASRAQKRGPASPREPRAGMEHNSTYFPSSRSNWTASESLPGPRARTVGNDRPSSSAVLPSGSPVARVIYDDGKADLCDVESVRGPDDVITKLLRQTKYGDRDPKSFVFYVMDGIKPNYANCRRLTSYELYTVVKDPMNPERSRLMVRRISHGDPEGVQLHAAAHIASEQARTSSAQAPSGGARALVDSKQRSWAKLTNILGEPLPAISYPMSPSVVGRRQELHATTQNREDAVAAVRPRPRPRHVDTVGDSRPDSEYVIADPSTYFPDVKKDEIEKSVRMAQRRSARLSRATSRLSTASRMSTASRLSVVSNFSIGSLSEDVPAVPAIPDAFVNGQQPGGMRMRPLSVLHNNRPVSTNYRDSIASSTLDPVDEDGVSSSSADNRKSYMSFGETSSAPGSGSASIADDGSGTINTAVQHESWVDDGASSPPGSGTENGGSLNELREAIAEDGEPPDEELDEFLTQEAWDNIKCIRGKLIGQGSFGSVYMALHTLTAELMAVKQVELPSGASKASDARKKSMIDALKREIALLRELKHANIVSYIGSNSDEANLYIFLEYVPGGSIAKMLVDYGPMQEEMVQRLVKQILTGLAYLHSKDIIHRDIKGANILVDTHGAVKISDFGISKKVQEQKAQLTDSSGNPQPAAATAARARVANRVSLQGSVFWMAPEVVKQTANTRKADIWSLGCLIVEMLTGAHPHPNLSQMQAIFKIGHTDPGPDIPRAASRDLSALLKSTFRIDYDERPEADELLLMPFFAGPGGAGGGAKRVAK